MMKKILCLMLLAMSIGQSDANEKLTVLLDWYANPNHAPLFVAQDKGYFVKQGLDVTLISPSDPSDPPKLVAAGKADIAITYEPKLIEQIDQGLPLIRIGTLVDQPLDCMVTLKSSHISSIADLKGKRIGYSNGGVNMTSLKMMLAHHQIPLSNVEAINVHYNLTQALLSGKVDAVTGMMRNFELTQLDLSGHPANAFYPEDNGLPTYSELIFVVHKRQAQDPRYAKFIAAIKAATVYLKAHPEETWHEFAKNHPELNDELNHRAWINTVSYFTLDPLAYNAKNWHQYAVFMFKNGLISQVQPISRYIYVN